jgi:DNA-binding protein H-NS
MKVDLKAMSRVELLKLRGDIDAAMKAAEKREKKEALKAAQRAAAEFGFSLDEISGGAKSAGAKKTKAAPKYQNPNNPEETWSGRGRKPKWVHEALSKGTDISKLEI